MIIKNQRGSTFVIAGQGDAITRSAMGEFELSSSGARTIYLGRYKDDQKAKEVLDDLMNAFLDEQKLFVMPKDDSEYL